MCLPQIYPVSCHTDHIGPGSTFVAITGQRHSGTQYVQQAIRRGATHIVIEQTAQLTAEQKAACRNLKVTRVSNSRKALAELSAQATEHAHKKLKLIGITGTKGKTTTAFILRHLLQQAGYKVACISTVHNSINGTHLPAQLTTEQPDYLHQFFAQATAQGVTYVVMEVAAQAVSLYRTHGLQFDQLIFTNFSHEHLEFYPTLEAYFAAKTALLEQLTPNGNLWLNGDDPRLRALHITHSYGILFGQEQHNAVRFEYTDSSTELALHIQVLLNNANISITCPQLLGRFNAANCTAALLAAHRSGMLIHRIQTAFPTFGGIPGRLQCIPLPNGAVGCIDYAHNPDSYQHLFELLRTRTDHLIVLFGAGGGRDTTKRPLMGAVAAQYADHIFLTSDNPRHEDPRTILDQIKAGIPAEQLHKVQIVLDRAEAIEKAYTYSRSGSFLVLLGKGPDEYQIIGDRKIPFSERTILEHLF